MRQTRLSVLLLFLLSCYAASADFFPEDDDDPFPLPRERFRRFVQFRVSSRKSHPDAPEETGIGFAGHARNVLMGGSFGINFKLAHGNMLGNKPPGDDTKSSRGFFNKRYGGENIEKEDQLSDYGYIINPRVRYKPEP